MSHYKRYNIPSGRAIYVDNTNGNDTNNGSASQPLKTVAKVNALTLKPYDKVMFKAGETWSGTQFSIPSHGKPHAPIFVGSYGVGAQPIIDVTTSATGALTCDTNYINISNICAKGGTDRTVKLGGSSLLFNNCTVIGDNVTKTDGIRVYGTNAICKIIVSNCTVYNSKCITGGGGGIGVQPNGATAPDYVTIENNTVYNCGSVADTDHGIYVKYSTNVIIRNNIGYGNKAGGLKINTSGSNVLIYNNRFYSNGTGMYLDNFTNGKVYNNICQDNAHAGIWFLNGCANGYIYHNTLVNNGYSCIEFLVTGTSGFDIKNNILFNDYNQSTIVGDGSEVVRYYDDAEITGNTWNNNLIYYANHSGEPTIMVRRLSDNVKSTFAQWQAKGADSNGISASPVFLTAYTDLHIQTTSPCKGAGTDLGILTDYDGVVRGASIDIGAFEYV